MNDLAELVDDLHIQPGSDLWKRSETIWERVVELEVGFWPSENELVDTKPQS